MVYDQSDYNPLDAQAAARRPMGSLFDQSKYKDDAGFGWPQMMPVAVPPPGRTFVPTSGRDPWTARWRPMLSGSATSRDRSILHPSDYYRSQKEYL
jgi:hypothetical protein